MTRKEQNKVLDAKIESNVNQYKVDRLNAEISAFSSGDLNKYEFLKRIDSNYKPNALDKARFEFSPLGKTFSTGLDKTAQGYQEEGIMKILKDIRDALAGGIVPRGPGLDRFDDDDDDNDDNMPDLETEEEAAEKIAKTGALNKFKNKIDNFDEMFRNKEDEFNKTFKDKEDRLNKLNNNVKKIKNYIEENNDKINNKEKEYNKLLLKYSEINRELNKTKDELYRARNDINEQKKIQEKLNYQNNEVEELYIRTSILKNIESKSNNQLLALRDINRPAIRGNDDDDDEDDDDDDDDINNEYKKITEDYKNDKIGYKEIKEKLDKTIDAIKIYKKNKKMFKNIPNIESKINKNEKFVKMLEKVLDKSKLNEKKEYIGKLRININNLENINKINDTEIKKLKKIKQAIIKYLMY